MKSSEYWQQRFAQLEASQHREGVACYAEIEKQYRAAQRELEGQITSWYGRFAHNNEMTMTEARRMLNAKELKELKWDVNEYIKYARENALDGKWCKELENASAAYHISRLEALKLHTQQCVEKMFGNQLDTIDSSMRDIYQKGYYHSAFEIQKGVGVGWDFSRLDERMIDKVIKNPWAADGKNFSERIWGNCSKLNNELNQTLTRNIILGQDPQKAIDQIAKRMDVSKSSAGRLVMTEEAYFSSEAQKEAFKDLDVEEYEIVATLDSHTSDICQEMDGKHFKMSEWEVGTTAPPFHVYCRSTTVPYFDDNLGERAARDAEGKTYYVPSDMTYKQWKKTFVKGYKSENIKFNNNSQDKQQSESKENIKSISAELNTNGVSANIDLKETFFNNLDSAKDTAEINKLASEYFRNKCDIQEVSFNDIDVDASKAMCKKLDDLTDRFECHVNSIKSAELKASTGGVCIPIEESYNECISKGDANLLRFDIQLSKRNFKSQNAIKIGFNFNHRSRYSKIARLAWVDEDNMNIASLVHEFGHSLLPGKANELLADEGIINKQFMACRRLFNQYKRDIAKLEKAIRDIKDQYRGIENGLEKGLQASAEKQKELDDLVVSNYSKERIGEFIAECFCDAECSSEPKEISKKVYEILKKGYGK
jgi:SPP1 gp7 family putative phage head morphogenesis protein